MPVVDASTVLVVEDNLALRHLICVVLELEGHAVETAADGQGAIDWMQAQRPALVLLDLGLPLVDGYGVAAALHAIYDDTVPLLVLTANSRAAQAAKAMHAQGYLLKPFDVDRLARTVQELLPAS